MKHVYRLAWFGVSMAAAMANATAAHAQNYPNKPITLVNPYAAGGPVDALARMLARDMGDNLKQTIIVVNKAGAGASIGAGYVAHSEGDGYTLLLGTAAAHYITPGTVKTPYDGLKDFAFIGMVDNAANVLVVTPALPVHSLKELVALAKAEPGKLNYGSSGTGTSPHIGMEEFKMQEGINLIHVPYRGAAPAVIDLAEGQVQVGLINTSGILPFVRAGKLRALAFASTSRSKALPDVPTFTEAGVPGFVSGSWHSLAVPATTPLAVVNRLAQALSAVQASPEFQKELVLLGTDPFVLGPAKTSAYIDDEARRTLAMFKATNMKIQ
jgi:tripartite-type tricarboxylate transporter receptor subunit TctC